MGKKRDREYQLNAAVLHIQRRYGPGALRRGVPSPASNTAAVPHIHTGFPALDRALGIGGLPKGRISELLGPATSGKTTLTLKFLAQAQTDGKQVGYIDHARGFDPDYAHRAGLDLSRLLVGMPYDLPEALAMVEALARSGSLAALAFDTLDFFWANPRAASQLTALLNRLPAPLARSGTVLIFLHESLPLAALAHYAAVRLQVVRERWLRRHGDIRGYEARVEVLKNPFGPAGRAVTIAIEFNGTVHGNGL